MGEAFVSVSTVEAEQLLDKDKERLSIALEEISDEVAGIKKEMTELKVRLYGKFGSAIKWHLIMDLCPVVVRLVSDQAPTS